MPAKKLPTRHIPHHAAITRISEWKQRMMEVLVEDQEIGKLLYYNSEDALSRPDLTEDERYSLVDRESEKRRIYPTRYTPKVMMDQQSFIGLSVSGFVPQEAFAPYRTVADKYVMGYLYFWILVDNQIMDCDEGQRQDLLLEKIYDKFQDADNYGMGRLSVDDLQEVWEQNNKFGGYVLVMKVIDMA